MDAGLSALVVETDPGTDFWRKTHYGFEADNGHFFYATVPADLVMMAKVKFLPVHQYDQAGLMVRVDRDCWIKTSVEYELDEPPRLGAVVTNAGYSDWSVQDFDRARSDVWLRISRKSSDFIIEHSDNGQTWKLIRVAHLNVSEHAKADCGLYACSPKGAGFRAEFDLLRIDCGSIRDWE
jgi:regulation of enolase protein 1 (concanavalin A-like superfamily)